MRCKNFMWQEVGLSHGGLFPKMNPSDPSVFVAQSFRRSKMSTELGLLQEEARKEMKRRCPCQWCRHLCTLYITLHLVATDPATVGAVGQLTPLSMDVYGRPLVS